MDVENGGRTTPPHFGPGHWRTRARLPGRPLPSALFSHVQPAPPTGSFASIAMAESPTHDEDVQITKGSRLAVLLEQEEMCAASDVP